MNCKLNEKINQVGEWVYMITRVNFTLTVLNHKTLIGEKRCFSGRLQKT